MRPMGVEHGTHGHTPRTLAGEHTPFVGREEERALLRRLLDDTAGGRGALAMIGGEARGG